MYEFRFVLPGRVKLNFRWKRLQVAVISMLLSLPVVVCAEDGVIEFQIPKQRASSALTEFAQQAGQQVLYSYDLANSVDTNPVEGLYTTEQAITMLLEGTGLAADFGTPGAIVVVQLGELQQGRDDMTNRSIARLLAGLFAGASVPALAQTAVLEEIIVTARKRDEALKDVPVSMTVFTAGDIDAAGIETPHDFIALTPNVTLVQVQNAGN